MANIFIPKPWQRLKPIEEEQYNSRRQVIKSLGLTTAGLIAAPHILSACTPKRNNEIETVEDCDNCFTFDGINDYFPAERSDKYTLDRPITEEYDATHYNNFYEFITREDPNIYNAYKFVGDFDTTDWKIEITGLVKNKGVFDLEDLIKRFGQEERTYRFRCVERWSMAVPWTGFQLSKLIKYLEPDNKATHVRFVSFSDPKQMPGVKLQTWYPWPYFEGLTMDEAMNELAFVATGIYGKPLPKQNGAPVRMVVPWKYGYKNPKSIVRIEFIDNEPETFWHQLAATEYGFVSNVNPEKPHPRWSQARERMIPNGEWRPTLKYNGYGEYVANLYES